MIEKLKHKYALSSKGAKDMVRAFIAVTLSNLVLMLPVGLLYLLASYLLDNQLLQEKICFLFDSYCGYFNMYCFNNRFSISCYFFINLC